MSGAEMLAIQGFDHGLQRSTEIGVEEYTEKQLVDLAGNSFTGAVLSAWSLAILGCVPWGDVLAVPREQRPDGDGGLVAKGNRLDDDTTGSESVGEAEGESEHEQQTDSEIEMVEGAESSDSD